jgi:hypothetical protein
MNIWQNLEFFYYFIFFQFDNNDFFSFVNLIFIYLDNLFYVFNDINNIYIFLYIFSLNII